MKALARDSFPADDKLADIEAALTDAETLGRAWDPEDGPPPLEPPSPRARAALASRVDRLRQMRDRAREVAGREAEQRRWAEEQRRWAAEQAEAEGADAGWRRELLAGPGRD